MGDAMCEDYVKAEQSRERQAQEHETKPYYWWEYPDPFPTRATPAPVVNPNGLARSRQELRKRTGKE